MFGSWYYQDGRNAVITVAKYVILGNSLLPYLKQCLTHGNHRVSSVCCLLCGAKARPSGPVGLRLLVPPTLRQGRGDPSGLPACWGAGFCCSPQEGALREILQLGSWWRQYICVLLGLDSLRVLSNPVAFCRVCGESGEPLSPPAPALHRQQASQ